MREAPLTSTLTRQAPKNLGPSEGGLSASLGRRLVLGIGAGFLAIFVAVLVLGLVMHRSQGQVARLLEQIIVAEEPASAAAYEMEINILGAGLGVWKYLTTGDAEHRERVRKDEQDFRRFRAEYGRLTVTPEEKQLADQIDLLFARYLGLGDALMEGRDSQDASMAGVHAAFASMDALLGERLQADTDRAAPDGPEKLARISAIQANVSHLNSWLSGLHTPANDSSRRRIETDVRKNHEAYLNLQLTTAERAAARQLIHAFELAVAHSDNVVRTAALIRKNQAEFISLRRQLDDLLDEGIQAMTRRDLAVAQTETRDAIRQWRVGTLLLLGLTVVVLVVAASAILRRSLQLRFTNDELVREIERRRASEDARAILLKQMVSAQENERGRLARELHDQMGQNLSALMLGLKGLSRSSEDGPSAGRPLGVQQLHDLTGRLLDQVHTLAWDLRPAELDHLGLNGALSNYIEEWVGRCGLPVDFYGELNGKRLPDHIETVLYRVAQEALSNVSKHAEAKTISVVVKLRGPDVVMVIEDDGRGFRPDQVSGPSSVRDRLGLLGINERVALAGGRLQVESAPSGGTTLAVTIPVAAETVQ